MILATSLYNIYPIIQDICDQYVNLRKKGYGREESILEIKNKHQAELIDNDDGPVIYIAIALALCKKRELTSEVQIDALRAIETLTPIAQISKKELEKLSHKISQESMLGREAKYNAVKQYLPNWNIGDTFAHKISMPLAKKTGIHGWYILIRKVGVYENNHKTFQLAYISLCPPDMLPKTTDELNSLGFLSVMDHDSYNDYMVQLDINRPKDEVLFELTKIGCFPDANEPPNQGPTNPFTAMPLSYLKSPDSILQYEMIAYMSYKKQGIIY